MNIKLRLHIKHTIRHDEKSLQSGKSNFVANIIQQTMNVGNVHV